MKSVSGRQLCKLLETRGWQLRRVRGSHHIYARAGSPVILTVPVHGNRRLKVGTLLSLLKAAALSREDL